MRDSMASSAAGVARLSFLIDLSALPAPDAEVRLGVAEIASVGLGVTWGIGDEDQARLAAEAGGGASDAAVVSRGAGAEERRQAALLAASFSLHAVASPVDASAPAARLRQVEANLWEFTPNRVWSQERRSVWTRNTRAHFFRAADARRLTATTIVVVPSDAVIAARTRSRLVRDLRALAELAKNDELWVQPLGGMIEEHTEATKGRPQRSILRAA